MIVGLETGKTGVFHFIMFLWSLKFVRQSYIYNIGGALHDMYHLYNLKTVENTHGGVLLLVKLQASARRRSQATEWVNLPAVERKLKIVPKPGVYLFAEEIDWWKVHAEVCRLILLCWRGKKCLVFFQIPFY